MASLSTTYMWCQLKYATSARRCQWVGFDVSSFDQPQDLQTVTVAAQRVQIILYRLQVQESAVLRATQRLEEARFKLADAESARKGASA